MARTLKRSGVLSTLQRAFNVSTGVYAGDRRRVQSSLFLSLLKVWLVLSVPAGIAEALSIDPTPTFTPLPPSCEGLLDGGFELGRPNPDWSEVTDGLFVITHSALSARSGEWLASFGGNLFEPLTQSLEQTCSFPSGGGAALFYYLRIPEASTDEADFLRVTVDGNQLAQYGVHDATDFSTYTKTILDLSDYADGGMHTIRFECSVSGAPVTSFRIDDVSLNICAEPFPTSTPTETFTASPTPTPTSTSGPPPVSLFEYSTKWTNKGFAVTDLIELLKIR